MGNQNNPTDKRDETNKGEREAGLERDRQAKQQGQDLHGKPQTPGEKDMEKTDRDAKAGQQQGGAGRQDQHGQKGAAPGQQRGGAGGATSKPDGGSDNT